MKEASQFINDIAEIQNWNNADVSSMFMGQMGDILINGNKHTYHSSVSTKVNNTDSQSLQNALPLLVEDSTTSILTEEMGHSLLSVTLRSPFILAPSLLKLLKKGSGKKEKLKNKDNVNF